MTKQRIRFAIELSFLPVFYLLPCRLIFPHSVVFAIVSAFVLWIGATLLYDYIIGVIRYRKRPPLDGFRADFYGHDEKGKLINLADLWAQQARERQNS